MTGREKILKLCECLDSDAEHDYDLSMKLLEKAAEGVKVSTDLRKLLPQMSEEQCEQASVGIAFKENS